MKMQFKQGLTAALAMPALLATSTAFANPPTVLGGSGTVAAGNTVTINGTVASNSANTTFGTVTTSGARLGTATCTVSLSCTYTARAPYTRSSDTFTARVPYTYTNARNRVITGARIATFRVAITRPPVSPTRPPVSPN